MIKKHLLVAVLGLAMSVGCSQPTPDQLMSQAREALANGQPRTAQIHLKNLLRQTPDAAEARALLGQASLALGDAVAAEGDLRRALELGADPAEVQLPLLRAFAAEGKFSDVLAQIEKGPAVEGKDRIEVLRLAGAADRALNRPADAEASYRSALAIEPDSRAVRADLAGLMLEQNRVDDARALIDAVLTEQADFGPALVLRGLLEFSARRLPEAEATFREVMQKEGPGGADYLDAWSRLIDTLLAEGSVPEAAGEADRLLAANPNFAVAIVLKAAVEIKQNALDSARQRLEALIAKSPTYEPANRLLGVINAKQGNSGQAQMYLQSAVTQEPGDQRAALHLAALHLGQGRLDEARKVLSNAVKSAETPSDAVLFALAGRASLEIGESDLSAQYFEQSARSLSDDPQDVIAVAAVYASSGDLARAQSVLRAASSASGDQAWTATYALALSQVRQNDLKAADATIERLIGQQPRAAWPLNLRGSVAILARDLPAARQYYSAALKIDPKYVPAMLNLARIERLEGKPDRAVEEYQRVLAIDPKQTAALSGLTELALSRKDYAGAQTWLDQVEDPPAHLRLEGLLAMAQGRADEAADRFADLYKAAPSVEAAMQAFAAAQRANRPQPEAQLLAWSADHPRDARANLALGEVAVRKQDYDGAIQRFETVVAADPKQAIALNNLAWLYSRKGDDRALGFAQRAHESAPDNPAVADTLGWLQVQRGEAAAALPLLEQSRKAMPDNREVRYHWAAALAKTGKKDEAAEELRKLLAGGEDFEGRSDAESLLKELK